MMHYKAIWISDVHLGTSGCQANYLLDFLKHNDNSNISSIPISLDNNTINISEQDNDKQYYKLILKNNDEVKYINTLLKNNQKAIILIKFDHYLDHYLDNNSSAIIYPIININTSYNSNIILTPNTPYAILKLEVIENLIFGECVSYYKNI